MKNISVQFARIGVGILFIFSGFIKLNDPIGFSYKLEEYFGEGVLNLEFLIPYALFLAVFIVIFEMLLGVTLLLGIAKKVTNWSLLLMILFFTFLTFYSAYFNKVTDCGCFGDAIPLTPWQSFYKDVVLLILILILFFNQKLIKPIFSEKVNWSLFLLSLIFSVWFGNHVLNHLPYFDFRGYQVGTNIIEGSKIPDGAPQAVYRYDWKFKIDGEEQIISNEGSYPEVAGEFIEVNTVLINEGYVPKIKDFGFYKDGEEYTQEILNEPKLMVISAYNLSKSENKAWSSIKDVIDRAEKENYKVVGLSASGNEAIEKLMDEYDIDIPFYFTDETAIKTIVRSNPGILVIEDAVILQKLHWNDAEETQF